MLKTVPMALFFVCICNHLLFGSVDSYDIVNRDFLARAKIIQFARMDSLDTFNGDLPQGYYIQLFMTALAMGVNGYTQYEVISENSPLKPDLIFKFTLLNLDYSNEKKPLDPSPGYKTRFNVEIHGYNPADKKQIFSVKKTCTSRFYNHDDELKDNILEATDHLILFLAKYRKEPTRKSFYTNSMQCTDMEDKKISYIILGNKKDPLQKKLFDVIEAEMQQYFFEKKILILKLEKPLDSLLLIEERNINLDSDNNVFDPSLRERMKKVSIDYIFIIDQLTGFKSESLLEESKFNFGSFAFVWTGALGGAMAGFIPGGESSADMEEMNAYDRLFCSLHVIDIQKNSTVLRTQRYFLAGYTCESPEKCFAREIVKELGEYEPESYRVYTCFGKNRKKGRKRKK
jgi:hypothetical protein